MDNRDMFYGGYQMMGPVPMYPNMGTNMYPNMHSNNNYDYIDNKISRIENQIKSINQRLNRLEAPYNNKYNSNYNNEPDNNMYMM